MTKQQRKEEKRQMEQKRKEEQRLVEEKEKQEQVIQKFLLLREEILKKLQENDIDFFSDMEYDHITSLEYNENGKYIDRDLGDTFLQLCIKYKRPDIFATLITTKEKYMLFLMEDCLKNLDKYLDEEKDFKFLITKTTVQNKDFCELVCNFITYEMEAVQDDMVKLRSGMTQVIDEYIYENNVPYCSSDETVRDIADEYINENQRRYKEMLRYIKDLQSDKDINPSDYDMSWGKPLGKLMR